MQAETHPFREICPRCMTLVSGLAPGLSWPNLTLMTMTMTISRVDALRIEIEIGSMMARDFHAQTLVFVLSLLGGKPRERRI